MTDYEKMAYLIAKGWSKYSYGWTLSSGVIPNLEDAFEIQKAIDARKWYRRLFRFLTGKK